MTSRLAARMASKPFNADPWTRSQFGWINPVITADVTDTGGVAHVVLHAGSQTNNLDLVMVGDGHGGLVVDDTQCTGRGPSTSIYVDSPPPCYST
jgi:hypothetical protein